ncbi:MAG: response regulator [Flavobacteriales bacterium]|nr:response regulator [Flavobacteriales bacterium]NCP85548.1 response regulator [Bacteroidota bacterium]NCQ10654.1 response regulator [Bacteroidota bacterium]NCT16388.1 response regulator [Flavobacteriales bacterium]
MLEKPKAKRILIIDDDEIFVFGLTKLIEIKALANNVVVQENGKKALDYIQNLVERKKPLPELILLDLNMPILDGWGFLDEFSALKNSFDQKIEVNIMSSSIAHSDYEQSKTYATVSGYFVKPISIPDLKKLLQT